MKILLLTNSDIVSKIIKLSLESLNIESKIVHDINDLESADILLVDDKFKDINFNIMNNFSSSIGIITDDTTLKLDANHFIINRPFLPSSFIKIIKENIKLINRENCIVTNSFDDESIVKIDSLDALTSPLNQDEIISLKDILIKDHAIDEVIEDENISELDEIIDNAIAQLKDDNE
jgi:hypothetical protein